MGRADTRLSMLRLESKDCLNLQFTDMTAGIVQSRFEFDGHNDRLIWDTIKSHVRFEELEI